MPNILHGSTTIKTTSSGTSLTFTIPIGKTLPDTNYTVIAVQSPKPDIFNGAVVEITSKTETTFKVRIARSSSMNSGVTVGIDWILMY